MAAYRLGDLSCLAESPECPEGHSYNTPKNGYCIAYGRDRGDENTDAVTYANRIEFLKRDRDQEFQYLFADGKWLIWSGYCWEPLVPELWR